MRCPRCGSSILPPATTCACAERFAEVSADAAPPPLPSPDDFVGRMIPSGNKPALISYYSGILALIPLVGIVFGAVAVIFGVKGLKLVARHPEVRGGIHAWVGLLLGGIFGLAYAVLAAVAVVAIAGKH